MLSLIIIHSSATASVLPVSRRPPPALCSSLEDFRCLIWATSSEWMNEVFWINNLLIMGLGSFTHGSRRNEWRWCPRRCSVAPSDPASPASESGSSRVSPAAPSHGSPPPWTRSPAGTWTRSPALPLTPGGGRRAETRGTPRWVRTDHRCRWSRLTGGERGADTRLGDRGRRDGGERGEDAHIYARVCCNAPPPLPNQPRPSRAHTLFSLSIGSFLFFFPFFFFLSATLVFWSAPIKKQ